MSNIKREQMTKTAVEANLIYYALKNVTCAESVEMGLKYVLRENLATMRAIIDAILSSDSEPETVIN